MNGLNFNDAVVSHMESLHTFHKSINDVLLLIVRVVLIGLIVTWRFPGFKFVLVEWIDLELIWTLVPAIILLFIGVPSIIILYQEFPDYDTLYILSIMGHQWYWSFVNLHQEEVDSFLDNKATSFRQLEVDNSLVLPLNEGVRVFVSSADVIHCFAVPALGIKADAVPGRMNELYIFPLKIGKYYGQCSEICGANHAFMPVSVEILPS